METDIKQQRIKRSKRRERAQRMHAKKHELDSGEEDELSSAKEKAQRPPPPNRRKKKEAMFDEDVVDGFAILSFKTYEDLEVSRPIVTRMSSARIILNVTIRVSRSNKQILIFHSYLIDIYRS